MLTGLVGLLLLCVCLFEPSLGKSGRGGDEEHARDGARPGWHAAPWSAGELVDVGEGLVGSGTYMPSVLAGGR